MIPITDYDMTPRGMLKIQPGDILNLPQGGQHICVRVSESNAQIVPLDKRSVTVTDKINETETTFERPGAKQSISSCISKELIQFPRLGRMALEEWFNKKKSNTMKLKLEPGDRFEMNGKCRVVIAVAEKFALVATEAGAVLRVDRMLNDSYLCRCDQPRLNETQRAMVLERFLQTHALSLDELTNKPESEIKDETTMALRKLKGEKKTGKARGGLAADAALDKLPTEKLAKVKPAKKPKAEKKAKVAGKGKRNQLGQIFGMSVCAVLIRLGKEGCSAKDATGILAAQKLEVKPETVSWCISAGVRGKGTPAELTREQVKELKAMIPEEAPAETAKAE